MFISILGSGFHILEAQEFSEKEKVSTSAASDKLVIPGGMPIGIYLETDGVLVLGTERMRGVNGLNYEPAAHLIKEGDYIVGINEKTIEDKKELSKVVSNLTSEEVILRVRREGEEIDVKIKPVQTGIDEYKLGIWVRDNAQGLGTLTFMTSTGKFGALGHGIHDVDTGELLEISSGNLYKASIRDIEKGKHGTPGGMQGMIVYSGYHLLGNITKNGDAGIYGTIDKIDAVFQEQEPLEIAFKEQIVEGPAKIRCTVDGTTKNYDIQITKVDTRSREVNKGLVIKVTDPKLLDITGGIVQGMSGSPIIQNDKLVGAVTHVLVNDPTRGYGIFIENMLDTAT